MKLALVLPYFLFVDPLAGLVFVTGLWLIEWSVDKLVAPSLAPAHTRL